MASNFTIYLFAIYAIFTTLPKNSIGSKQSITFFSDFDCPFAGVKQIFTDTSDQIKGSWAENANSTLIVGL